MKQEYLSATGYADQLYRKEEIKGEKIALFLMIGIASIGFFIVFFARNQIHPHSFLIFLITIPVFILYSGIMLTLMRQGKYKPYYKYLSAVVFTIMVMLNLVLTGGYRNFKNPIFILFFIIISISTLRFSGKLMLFTGITILAAILFLILQAWLRETVIWGMLHEAYISEKVSLLDVIVKTIFISIFCFAQYYTAERYRYIVQQSVDAELEAQKERLEVAHIKSTFSRYVSQQLAEKIIEHGILMPCERRKITVLFCDIRNFTRMSENLDPREVIEFLNNYFSRMIDVIFEYDGTLDKFIGDSIMAYFGAPLSSDHDEENAVRAAIQMRRELLKINQNRDSLGKEPICFGIGIHTGDVVVGNIGSERRMEYTVIGHAVNLASRIEGLTKALNTDILLSKDTFMAVRYLINARPQLPLVVKGIANPIETYQVLNLRK